MRHHKTIASKICRKHWNVKRQWMRSQKKCNPLLLHRTLNSFQVLITSCFVAFSLVCENVSRESEKRCWDSLRESLARSAFLGCVCVTFLLFSTPRSVWTVLFLFQLKFYILGEHTRLLNRGRDYFTFAFSVFISLRFVHKSSEYKNFSLVFFGDLSSNFMTYQFEDEEILGSAWPRRPMDRE